MKGHPDYYYNNIPTGQSNQSVSFYLLWVHLGTWGSIINILQGIKEWMLVCTLSRAIVLGDIAVNLNFIFPLFLLEKQFQLESWKSKFCLSLHSLGLSLHLILSPLSLFTFSGWERIQMRWKKKKWELHAFEMLPHSSDFLFHCFLQLFLDLLWHSCFTFTYSTRMSKVMNKSWFISRDMYQTLVSL
jgi:hypothetical protein